MRAHVAWLVLSFALPAAADPGAVDFESRRPGEVAVPVTIGSRGPFRFLVDTGSTHSAISADLGRRLSLRAIARAPVTASAGTVECLVVALTDVAVGTVAIDELAATQLPDEATATLGPGVDGILGQDFLARFSFTIDYRRSRIRWHDVGAPEPHAPSGVRLALLPSQDRFVVELPQEGGVRPLRVVPDSGADTLVLYDDPLVAGLRGAWAPGSWTLASPTGVRDVRTAAVDGLRVGDRTLGRQTAVILPARPGAAPAADREPAPDGLLPLHLFAQASFNARERWLVLQPW